MRSSVFILLTVFAAWSIAAPTAPVSTNADPTVALDNGVFTGRNNGTVNKFLGISYALPPVGDLRFQLPQPNAPYAGTYDVGEFGSACIQQTSTMAIIPPNLPILVQLALEYYISQSAPVANQSEDCLNLDVITPANVTANSSLPVLVWIYGGGFEAGSTSSLDGGIIVQRSVELNEPVIYVAMNYRVTALGFLDGREVREARIGNIGLQDQRQALRWIQKYVSAFGGDPTKVTIWGESAGGISVALQMLTNGGDTEGLFRGAFMQSGGPIPSAGTVDTAQIYFDMLVDNTNCTSAPDKLDCLRQVPIDELSTAIDMSPSINSYQELMLAWIPRNDGVFLNDTPQKLVQQGSVATIPFITGNCDDEGTAFSFFNANITTDDEVHEYMATNYLAFANSSSIDELLRLYPQDPTQGSPFDTGTENQATPQFKRLAALQGDIVFQAPRRFFLEQRADKQETWSFLSKRLKAFPYLGSFHGSDLGGNVYAPAEMTDYLVRFATSLDPNGNTGIPWPQYTNSTPQLLTFNDGDEPLTITEDTYRQEAMTFVIELSVSAPS